MWVFPANNEFIAKCQRSVGQLTEELGIPHFLGNEWTIQALATNLKKIVNKGSSLRLLQQFSLIDVYSQEMPKKIHGLLQFLFL